ncbi:hypothetical protein DL764_002893 [Monosporascus ibericus]|uniref:Uncharacterized protein n=1 Tax=Monosporascus ibericus TaxID=155417 RepID=A0A4Q4TIN3_9PEZI|nr:hypothetical protein DL764_002893 [Monosporascus ibericus]
MPSDKDRLYIALYARGGAPRMPGREDSYHWAFIVGPKVEPNGEGQGIRFHAKEKITVVGQPPRAQSQWVYDASPIPLQPTAMLLVRVAVGKVKDMRRLRAIFDHTPVRPGVPGWNCVGWIREALETALRDGKALGTAVNNWDSARDAAMWYVEKKKAEHRFDGRGGRYDPRRAATWDMLERKELFP